MTKQPSTLVYTRHDVFPTHHGAAVKIVRLAECESTYNRDVILASPKHDGYWIIENKKPRYIEYPRLLNRTLRFLQKTSRPFEKIVAMGIPDHEAYVYGSLFDRSAPLKLLYLAAKYHVDRLRAEFSGYVKPLVTVKKVFRLFGKKLPLLMSHHNIEFIRIGEQNQLRETTFEWLKNVETYLCKQVDYNVVVSRRDQRWIKSLGVADSKIEFIPHGVDLGFDKHSSLRDSLGFTDQDFVLIYHGTFEYPPNREALESLIVGVLPQIRRRGLNAKVLAVGNLPPRVFASKDVVMTGAVKDIGPYLKAADLAVVPLKHGGGTRMKILDYFASGVPVVSTTKGAEGLDLTNGTHLVLADSENELADAILALSQDKPLRSRLAQNGKEWVKSFDWTEIAARYENLIARFHGRQSPPEVR